mgnify:CR=1 FL=1|nr:hypothetical protein [uncultured Lachnoclostridium sp.]
MLNIEKYKDEIVNQRDTLLGTPIQCIIALFYMNGDRRCSPGGCDSCIRREVKWLFEEYKGHILNEEENKYLSAVIGPFRDKIECIIKRQMNEYAYIEIYLRTKEIRDCDAKYYSIKLYRFVITKEYTRMVSDKKYTLDELGL